MHLQDNQFLHIKLIHETQLEFILETRLGEYIHKFIFIVECMALCEDKNYQSMFIEGILIYLRKKAYNDITERNFAYSR